MDKKITLEERFKAQQKLSKLPRNSAKTRVIDLTVEQLGFAKKDSKKYIFSEEHQDQYMTAINIFKDKPFFGVGIKNFRNKCSEKKYISGNYPCSSHPHNIYVQLLSETGFFGFIILVIYVILHFIIKYW